METLNPGWLIAGVIAIIIVWTNPRLRAMFILSVLLFLLLAAGKSLIHEKGCGGASECLVELQPTWAGFCYPSNGAILKSDGRYFLTAETGEVGRATCLDWRVWQ